MAASTAAQEPYSLLVRLRTRWHYELPALSGNSEALTPEQEQPRPKLEAFIKEALEDGHKFVTTTVPTKFASKRTAQTVPPSTAKVDVSAYEIKATDLPSTLRKGDQANEAWFARTSEHENAAKAGTADWAEFDAGLRVHHSVHEKDYTPNVLDANQIYNWNTELDALGRSVAGWEDVQMEIREMRHNIPTPLNDRVFTTLVVTGKRAQELLVVQVPVYAKGLPSPKYHKAPKVTAGRYVSVEHCEVIDGGAKVRWRMATASDAGGSLPMFIQKLALPGAIAKDVSFFVDWCAKNRK